MNPPAQPAPRPSFRNRGEVASPRNGARGITLIELLVVLTILVALAGMVTISISRGITIVGTDGKKRTPEEIVTLATMQAVRDALIGTSASDPGYRGDLGALPSRLGGLLIPEPSVVNAGLDKFNPATKRGWRGPYLQDGGVRYREDFKIGNGFPPFTVGDPLILDAWGNPLVLGHEEKTEHFWLVSAGPNRDLETDLDDSDHLDSNGELTRGDDLVLFLLTLDPNL